MNDNFCKQIKFKDEKETLWSKWKMCWYDFKHSIPYYYRISRYYWKLRSIFIPQQKWLRKVIPREYMDKTGLLWPVMKSFIIHFVNEDGEDCFNRVHSGEEFENQLRQYYEDINVNIPALEKRISEEWDKIDLPKGDINEYVTEMTYQERYGKIDELEKQLDDWQKKIMHFIIEFSSYFWT